MPDGVTADNVSTILFDTLTKDQLSKARSTKEPLFSYTIVGRKSDRSCMFTVRDTLTALLKMSGSTIIDKTVLEAAFRKFDAKAGFVMSQSSSDPADQSYALKCMLQDIGRTKRSSVTGARLAPWLKELCDMVTDEPAEVVSEADGNASPAPEPSVTTAASAAALSPVPDRKVSTPPTPPLSPAPTAMAVGESPAAKAVPRCYIYAHYYSLRIAC